MRKHIITYEDACKLKRVWNDIDPATNELLIAASKRDDCTIYADEATSPVSLDIVVESSDIGNAFVGFLIVQHREEINVYAGRIEPYGIQDDVWICSTPLDTPLDKVIDTAKNSLNTCPECGKKVPFAEQDRYSFAGRCCKECLPAMKTKYEYPGWYN